METLKKLDKDAIRFALAARVSAELTGLAVVVERTTRVLEKAERDDDLWAAVAYGLLSYGCGAERIMTGIAREIDREVPDGSDSRRELIMQMSAGIRSTRPAVLEAGASDDLLRLYMFCDEVLDGGRAESLAPECRDLVRALPRFQREMGRIAVLLQEDGLTS